MPTHASDVTAGRKTDASPDYQLGCEHPVTLRRREERVGGGAVPVLAARDEDASDEHDDRPGTRDGERPPDAVSRFELTATTVGG